MIHVLRVDVVHELAELHRVGEIVESEFGERMAR
jgi:hypothetical protein